MLDVRLPDGDGVARGRELRSRTPDLACLTLASCDDEEALLDSIMAGASRYVPKQTQGSDLVSAVRTVARDQSLLDPGATTGLMARLHGEHTQEGAPDDLADLTDREREILALIGEGLTTARSASGSTSPRRPSRTTTPGRWSSSERSGTSGPRS